MPDEPTRPLPDDKSLALRAKQGCMDSFEELLRRHQTPLLHFLGQFAARADAEDIAQETFIRAYRNLEQYDPRWRFSTWLFTIAKRLTVNHGRRNEGRKEKIIYDASATAAAVDRSAGPAAALAAVENKRKIWEVAKEVLTEDQFAAIWLHYVEDLPLKDIAAVLGRFTPATKMILHRARQKLFIALKSSDLRHD